MMKMGARVFSSSPHQDALEAKRLALLELRAEAAEARVAHDRSRDLTPPQQKRNGGGSSRQQDLT